MEYTAIVSLAAPAARAWATLADLSGWSDWIPTVESIEPSIKAPVEGQRVAVKQPGRRITHYTIEQVEHGNRFRWSSRGGGVRQWADHSAGPRHLHRAPHLRHDRPGREPFGAARLRQDPQHGRHRSQLTQAPRRTCGAVELVLQGLII